MDCPTFPDESWGMGMLKHKSKLQRKSGNQRVDVSQITEGSVAFKVGAGGLGLNLLKNTGRGKPGPSFPKPLWPPWAGKKQQP